MTLEGAKTEAAPATLRLHLAILLVFVFASGLFSGLLARRLLAEPVQRGSREFDVVFYDHMSRAYGLDEAQRRLLRLVLEDSANQTKTWRKDLMQRAADQNRLMVINRQRDRRIHALLKPAQRRAYETLLREKSN